MSTIYGSNRIHKDFEKILEALIKISFKAQKVFEQDGWFIDTACTVKLCGPRRIGHTMSMAKVAYKMFDKPCFLFPNEALAQDVRSHELRTTGRHDNDVHSYAQERCLQRLRGRGYDAVFVDDASHCLDREKLYQLQAICAGFEAMARANGKPFCLVLLG